MQVCVWAGMFRVSRRLEGSSACLTAGVCDLSWLSHLQNRTSAQQPFLAGPQKVTVPCSEAKVKVILPGSALLGLDVDAPNSSQSHSPPTHDPPTHAAGPGPEPAWWKCSASSG